jgi:tellurite resistance protein TerC
VVIETTDLVFALDSIPAILAITRDEFIIYSSNAFAILGLRALYFAVSGIMRLFHYLHYGLSLILVFVGIKMLLSDFYHIPTPYALAVIGGALVLSIIASILYPKEEDPVEAENLPDE